MSHPAPEPPIRIAVVGLGKIARDQHLPALAADDRYRLVATASPQSAGVDGVAHFNSLEALLAGGPAIDAVALCTPPQVRHRLAARALEAGLHVLLEKPPGVTISEVEVLVSLAQRRGATLFAAWHSRFAGGVAPAATWLGDRTVTRVDVVWREDVRAWHPGQAWIWEPGGLGVFDPGINALSIATAVLPEPVLIVTSTLVVPVNRAAPIAARLGARTLSGAPMTVDLDWRQTGPQTWDITVDTDRGRLQLQGGGACLVLPDGEVTRCPDREYAGLYAHFDALIRRRECDVDLTPFRLVADAFFLGGRELTEPFDD